ncbi:MAG: DUF2231 domain-containing protein [Pyrinomonadaceae bacterium]
MESRAKVLGHSLHPMTIVFPLGLLSTATIFDSIALVLDKDIFPVVAFWMIVAGLIGGLAASIFGWIDWFVIPSGTRAKRVGLIHALANGLVMLMYLGSDYLRYDDPAQPTLPAILLSFAGFATSLIGGWLGGELVERLGVAVHTGANINAPSSLVVDPPLIARDNAEEI